MSRRKGEMKERGALIPSPGHLVVGVGPSSATASFRGTLVLSSDKKSTFPVIESIGARGGRSGGLVWPSPSPICPWGRWLWVDGWVDDPGGGTLLISVPTPPDGFDDEEEEEED